MSFHFRYGGSTAKRTLNCPGWIALVDKLTAERGPLENGGPSADRGTMLHNACEALIKDDLEYDDLLKLGIEYNGIKLTEELLDTKVVPAIEALDDLVTEYNAVKIQTEELVKYNDDIGGTIDITAEAKKFILFADYKFGEGNMVYAMGNDQLLFYAWTKLSTCKFTHPLSFYEGVVLAIIQPADRRDEPLDVWVVSVEQVMDFGERFLAAVEIAETSEPGESLCTGEHCMFCPAAKYGDCPAKVDEANHCINQLKKLDTATESTEDNPYPVLAKKGKALEALDIEQALDLAERLEPWIKDVRAFACKGLEAGNDIEGWKLVPKRATKKWIDTDRTTKYLKRKLKASNALASKVITPAQALKVAKTLGVKLKLDDHISAESSGTTLVRESDPRQAAVTQADVDAGLAELAALGQLDLELEKDNT